MAAGDVRGRTNIRDGSVHIRGGQFHVRNAWASHIMGNSILWDGCVHTPYSKMATMWTKNWYELNEKEVIRAKCYFHTVLQINSVGKKTLKV